MSFNSTPSASNQETGNERKKEIQEQVLTDLNNFIGNSYSYLTRDGGLSNAEASEKIASVFKNWTDNPYTAGSFSALSNTPVDEIMDRYKE